MGQHGICIHYVFFGEDEVLWTQVLVDPWFGADEEAPHELQQLKLPMILSPPHILLKILLSFLWNKVELKTHVFSGSEKLFITNNPAIYLRHQKSAA